VSTFFIADTHFGHGNILKYCKRPFLNEEERKMLAEHRDFRVSRESVELNDATIINNINAIVGEDDTLWHLGDFCFADEKAARGYRDRIVCQNVNIVWGNHDKPARLRHLFGQAEQQIELSVEGQNVFLNHYPMLSWDGSYKGCWNFYGHVHGNLRKNPIFRAACDIMLNVDVGVDGPDFDENGFMADHKFVPWSMKEIANYMNNKVRAFKENRIV
jgi:calcineurin-like phosphoesterase family protein